MQNLADQLRTVLAHEEPLLRAIDEPTAQAHDRPNVWSKKQELGHLLDSATNNRVRFVIAAHEGTFKGPAYAQDAWVDLGGYDGMKWTELVDLWKALNSALAGLIARIPDDRRAAHCEIGGSAPATLEFVIDDYIQHMQHHLDHILSREQVRSYPSAAKTYA